MQIAVKGQLQPLCVSLSHNDFEGLGAYVFWSKRNPRPHFYDCDGMFKLIHPRSLSKHTLEHKIEPFQMKIMTVGDSQFTQEIIYLGLYCFSTRIKVTLSISYQD